MTDSSVGDFVRGVLDGLERRKVTFHGCRPFNVEWETDGTVHCVFVGFRHGKSYEGRVSMRALLPADASHGEIAASASPEAIVNACASIIHDNNVAGP